MTGLETLLVAAGTGSTAIFGTFVATARYFTNQVVSKELCKSCREGCAREMKQRDDSLKVMLTEIGALTKKYDRILKILILKSDLPDDTKEEILP